MCCIHCGKSFEGKLNRLKKHQERCDTTNGIEGHDFVRCKLCNLASKSITAHVKREHNVSKNEYIEKYGSIKCTSSTENYSSANKVNSQWIERAKAEGRDLTEYKEKMAKAVSAAIISNPVERARRAKQLSDLNKTTKARKRSSETAKITSRRRDVVEQRTLNLANWRAKNPLEFYEKCTSAAHRAGYSTSVPEITLYNIVYGLFPDAGFEHSTLYNSEALINKSGRAQLDIISRNLKVAVEFDGIFHFKQIFKLEQYQRQIERDRNINDVLPNEGWCLIRVSYECWDGSRFKGQTVGQLYDIISDAQSGVHFIGEKRAGIDV